jgi:hypothetical protein
MNSRIKLLLILFSPILMLFGYVFVAGAINYSGYCWEQNRWLSDEEYIMAAARLVQVEGPGQDFRTDPKDNPEYARKRAIQEKEGRVLAYEDPDPELWDTVVHNGQKVHYPKPALKRLNVEDFFKKNPNCCKLVGRLDSRFIRSPDFLELFDGNRGAMVEVQGAFTFYNAEKKDRITLNKVKTYVAVTNCGYPNYDATLD